MQTQDEVEGLHNCNSIYANTGKNFSIAFIKKLSREKKTLCMALIKREILTSCKILSTKSCTRNQLLFCKKIFVA